MQSLIVPDAISAVFPYDRSNVSFFSQLVIDKSGQQLIVGARDYLFKLNLQTLDELQEVYWPATEATITTCIQNSNRTQDDCRNYIKVLLMSGNAICSCGTHAFNPQCTWRKTSSLDTVISIADGDDMCPYLPDANTSALVTSGGDFILGSRFGPSGKRSAVFGHHYSVTFETLKDDKNWLHNANFVAFFEIDGFVYFFFRETAVEYIEGDPVTYSRIGRVCKNETDKRNFFHMESPVVLKRKKTPLEIWHTFIKVRLVCSIPGDYPFNFDEVQSVYYVEEDKTFYATFTTPVNSLYGTAICGYKVSTINETFRGEMKYQHNSTTIWMKATLFDSSLFQCELPYADYNSDHSRRYKLINDDVQSYTSHPLYIAERQRLSHIVVDVVRTKNRADGVLVMFAATFEGNIKKMSYSRDWKSTCLIGILQIFPKNTSGTIMTMKLLSNTALYIGTENGVFRVPVHSCHRHKTKKECWAIHDPYCGWNSKAMACTTDPGGSASRSWMQSQIDCPHVGHKEERGTGLKISWPDLAMRSSGAFFCGAIIGALVFEYYVTM